MKLALGDTWAKKLKKQINRYEIEVGVLDDKTHMQAVEHGLLDTPKFKTYAGGPVRLTSRMPGESTIGQVLVENMKRLNINILLRPFQERNSDILKFTNYFLKYIVGGLGGNQKRVENLAQAIVRNPILKQEYGPNKAVTADFKGFNRNLFDTGQMFRAIRARVQRRTR